jgi:hypothetical protein
MDQNERTKIIIDTLIKESMDLRKHINDAFVSIDRYIAISTALTAAGFTVGLVNDHPVVIILLPLALLPLYTYLFILQGDALNRAGHRCHLEVTVNQELERAVLIEEAFVIASRQRGRKRLPLLQAFIVLIAVSAIGFSLWKAFSNLPFYAAIPFTCVIGFQGCMLYAAFVEMSQAFDKGYKAARATASYYREAAKEEASEKKAPAPDNLLIGAKGPWFLWDFWKA